MNNTTSEITPPVVPPVPVVPPPQTILGTLSSDGQPSKFDSILPGLGPNQQLWFARDELVGQFTFDTMDAEGTRLASIDVMRCCGGPPNNPENPSRPENNNLLPRIGQWNIALPRSIALNCAQYFSSTINYTFWAIKPPGTRGKLRFTYLPFYQKRTNSDTLALDDNINEDLDNLLRSSTWSWDMEKSDIFSLEFNGNNPLSVFPTGTHISPYVSEAPAPQNSKNNTSFWPLFSTRFGVLVIEIQNIYTPGSIFPGLCNIYVFKNLKNCKLYVERSPRSCVSRTVI